MHDFYLRMLAERSNALVCGTRFHQFESDIPPLFSSGVIGNTKDSESFVPGSRPGWKDIVAGSDSPARQIKFILCNLLCFITIRLYQDLSRNAKSFVQATYHVETQCTFA